MDGDIQRLGFDVVVGNLRHRTETAWTVKRYAAR
jgi:hypothetical protein